MGRVKRKEIPLWAKTGHKKPVTRRDFLACGMIPFVASALVPGALGLLAGMPEAHAAGLACPTEGSALAPFITINLSGGAGLSGNWVPRDKGGQLLPSYGLMGLGSGATLPIETEFGVPAFAGSLTAGGPLLSKILDGIRVANAADLSVLAKTAFLGVCVQSRDDSPGNSFDASGLVFKAGLAGGRLPNLGTAQTNTGVNQMAATVTPPPPLVVGNLNDLANSIGYTAALRNALTVDQRSSLTKLVSNLSGSQVRKLASVSSAAQVQNLVQCAGIKNTSLISMGSSAIDPLANGDGAGIAPIWGNFTAATAVNNQDRIFGSMVYNALNGNAGTASFNMGGYDYHTGDFVTGDAQDARAGQLIGRILKSAAAMNKPVFIYVTSDGATSSTDSAMPRNGGWNSDRGTAGSAMVFIYDPKGRPQTSGHQIGNYTTGQVADDSHIVGNNPEIAAQAVFANYLQFNKSIGLFDRVVGRSAISGEGLKGVLKVV